MAIAIREIELTHSIKAIQDLGQYEKVLILFRYRGTPVGSKLFRVAKGIFDPTRVDDFLSGVIRKQVADVALQRYLNFNPFTPRNYKQPTATVAVCTRNRADDLEKCLQGIMKLEPCGHQVIIVDNCPSDDSTQQVVSRFPEVRYVREDRPGLDIARNRAMREADTEVVAFIDDDAIPDPLWLKSLLQNFSHPMVMAVTGITMPLELESEAQIQFETYAPFCKGFQRRRWNADINNPLATGQVGAGANMALRKCVTDHVGWFDEALDAGTATQSGGDHEMFARILCHGYEIIYEPAALNWHRHRRSWQELKQALYGYGSGVYAHWARMFFVDKEYSVAKLPVKWFFHSQLPRLIRSFLKRPNSVPSELLLTEMKGCIDGIPNYKKAKGKVANL